MSFAYGFGLPHWQPLSGGFNPSSLFVGGVQGTWFDPSDPETLFSDTAGTTPSPTPGAGALSVVGLMLDKSQGGVGTNGAYRYNLLTYTEQFDNAAWQPNTSTVTANTTVAPNGTTTADTLVPNSGVVINTAFAGLFTSGASSYVTRVAATALQNVPYTASCYVKAGTTLTHIQFRNGSNADLTGTSYNVIVRLADGFVVNADGTATSQSVGNGWYRITLTFTPVAGSYYSGFWFWNDTSITCNGSQNVLVWGAQLAVSTAPTAYQRITDTWYATIAGNHAISYNTTTARPELSARVNLLTYSEQFNNAAWSVQTNLTFTTGVTDPNGGSTAMTITATGGSGRLLQFVTTGNNVTSTASIWIRRRTGTGDINWEAVGVGVGPLINVTSSWQRVTYTATVTGGGIFYYGIRIATVGDAVDIAFGDIRPSNIGTSVPAYQRIADQYTYDSSGFPRYLVFNGTASGMYTPANLNLSATDKATVFAGVRKLDNTTTLQFVELSASLVSNAGAFSMPTNPNTTGQWGTFLSGSTGFVSAIASGTTAPITTVNAGLYDIALSADETKLRINGAQVATSGASSAGTGNFGTYPLYIGSRNNSSLWFNGYLYSMIVVGTASTAAQISSTESWINGKEGGVY